MERSCGKPLLLLFFKKACLPLYKNDPKLENKDEPTKTTTEKERNEGTQPSSPSRPNPQQLPLALPKRQAPRSRRFCPCDGSFFLCLLGETNPNAPHPLCLPHFVLQIGILLPGDPTPSSPSSPIHILSLLAPHCALGGAGLRTKTGLSSSFSGPH